MKQYSVTGMSCAACSARVEKAVAKVDGVTSCSVSLLTNTMGVEGTADENAIIRAVEDAGYGASSKETGQNQQQPIEMKESNDETGVLKKRLITSAVFLLVLMYISMGHMMWDWPLPSFFTDNHVAMGLAQLILTVVIMVINQKFFVSGYRSLYHLAPNMDTLVALGSTAAFVYSTYALFAMTRAQVDGNLELVMSYMHEFYFESAAMILTLITLGKLLEAYSKGKTTNALKGLMDLAPKTATVIRNNKEIVVPATEVKINDIFIVRPGESVPVDGEVVEGTSAINESALTGESIPVDKVAGDQVSAATINQSGFLTCKATRVGEDTTLAQIIQLMSDAAATKAPIAKVADRVSGVFVPVVILIAIITTVVWMLIGHPIGYALARGISVLVISCPCALGLATPVAIMVGNGMGAKHGIMFKTAVSLEETGKVDIVVLDKTGTITSGKPEVTNILPSDVVIENELLFYAYTLEKKSEHPLSAAIKEYAFSHQIQPSEVKEFSALPGHGLRAEYEGKVLLAGNQAFVEETTKISSQMKEAARQLSDQGKTPLFFAYDNQMLGIIAVADVIKEESAAAISQLKSMGIHVVMLTGDNERTAKAVAKDAGVDEVIAGVLPEGKESKVSELKTKGRVIMVGDGINDAPALASANIGMAIGAGTDIAMDAADVVLVNSKLSDVTAAIKLSRATLRNIHENLFWAFIYNVIGIPLAAGLFIPLFGWELNPMFGAAAMSLSSFSVVSNALRLNLFKVNKKKKVEVLIMKKTMTIEGMMCGHCEARVKKSLEDIASVEEAVVSHEKGTAVVSLNSDVDDAMLKKTVEEQGYQVMSIE